MRMSIRLLFLLSLIVIFIPSKGLASENLQAIIDSADDGAVIQLENKTYEGNIVINKQIEIIGDKKTVIKGDGTGNVVSIRSPYVTIRNLTVTNSSLDRNSSEEYAAIKVYTDHNVIDSVIIKHFFHGIYLSQAHFNTVQNSEITGLGKGQIANQGNGLHVYYANDNILKNNVIEGTRDGMFFDYANRNQMNNNRISETRYGLHYMYSDHNAFEGNTFTFNTGGAAIMHSRGIKLENNQFIFNYGHKSFGLLLLSAIDTVIEENTFFLNQRGLYIDQSTNSLIKNNQIIKNQIGVELWASSNEQNFTLNTIDENTLPAVTLGGQGRNEWSVDQKGNNWGKTFPVLDLNQDGIGDQPISYQSSLYELIEDQELTYLFLKSPAVAVYEKLNQFFNKNETMFEDPFPLVKNDHPSIHWIWYVLASLLILTVISIKGRHQLCIIFGKNGRKT
ncbi:nitrous oxidase accessory protein [Cytobacillus eiseniae]|uniref:Nitrous oxidase accessory protein n=1 Tax=Cytobacillus eiseniae TaxID=762947 RepID=A0ABS4RKG8_9BACI|nr:nitrous oxide reductase family maturation protein NosD [Cytobacillus eiseniae]MBP2243229.1 nitrous oxidase accessory protein [Cytobacillus eiseniae]